MDYYEKYLKYKTKYTTLKNKIGGMPIPYSMTPPLINYKLPVSINKPVAYPIKKYFIVYGTFEDKIIPLIEKVKKAVKIKKEHEHPIFKKTILEPHTSLVYEPEYFLLNDNDFEEYKKNIGKITNLDDLYPDISKYLEGIDNICDLVLEGASAFFRETLVIIKIGFNSKKMNDLRNKLYSSDKMKEYEKLWRQKVSNPVIKQKYGKSKYYKDDETFNLDEPKLWIHVTIGALNPATTSIDEIDSYLDKINEQVKDKIGDIYSINKIKIRDPEMNNTIIWNENKVELLN